MNISRIFSRIFMQFTVADRVSHFNIKYNRMAINCNFLKPPQEVEGLTVLDKSLFKKVITVPCLEIKGLKLSTIMPIIKKYLLKMEHFKPVKANDHETLIYLNPAINCWNNLEEDDQKALQELSLTHSNLKMQEIILQYENFSVELVLRAVLPKDAEGFSSFTKVGHIVHVNLREHLLPYKDIIGQVILDKVPGCKTVVNKAAIIDNTFRNFQIEILKGENKMLTQVKENKCKFEFDFSKVYWNSRLCTEHERIVNMVKTGDVVFDVFAGVGPFSLPIARKKCTVYANDLNPESYKWLNHNKTLNKIDNQFFKSFNKDGRDFIVNEVKQLLPQHLTRNVFIIMNLPAMAVDFLSAFVGLFKEEELAEMATPPTVIVYTFAKGDDYLTITKNQIFQSVSCDISEKILDIFRVRTVSSLKEMMRVTFRLDRDLLTGSILLNNKRKHAHDECDDVAMKKCCNGEEQAEEK